MFRVLALIAAVTGCAFGYVAVDLLVHGTGAALPSGSDVCEGPLQGESSRSPLGDEPLLFGEARVEKRGAAPLDAHFTAVLGSPSVTLSCAGEQLALTLPAPATWKGRIEPSREEVASLAALPNWDGLMQAEERLGPPPYIVSVTALRPGDPVIVRQRNGRVTELLVGERAALEAWREAREEGRFPIIAILAVMAVVSFLLARAAWKRHSTQEKKP